MEALNLVDPKGADGTALRRVAGLLEVPGGHANHAVGLTEIAARLADLFHNIGGTMDVEIRAIVDDMPARGPIPAAATVLRAGFNGEVLWLPARISVFSAREANVALYAWLAALAVHAPPSAAAKDPLQRDLATLGAAVGMITATLAVVPSLKPLWRDLSAAHLAVRARRALPEGEEAVENIVRCLLGDPASLPPLAELFASLIRDGNFAATSAPRQYRPFAPVPLWPELRQPDRPDP